MMNKFNQGRFLVTSLVRNCSSFRPIPRQPFVQVLLDKYGFPKHSDRVFDVLRCIRSLTEDDKIRYGPVFCELLGLPKPPKNSTKRGDGEIYAVRLIKFDKEKGVDLIHAIASIKLKEAPRTLSDLGLASSTYALDNLPSVIKQGITVKQAKKIIAKIEAAGGEADMVLETISSDDHDQL